MFAVATMLNVEGRVCALGVVYAGKGNSIVLFTCVAPSVQLETQAMLVR
jgi:hypothetical protein